MTLPAPGVKAQQAPGFPDLSLLTIEFRTPRCPRGEETLTWLRPQRLSLQGRTAGRNLKPSLALAGATPPVAAEEAAGGRLIAVGE